MSSPAVELTSLGIVHRSGRREVTAVDGLDLVMERGQVTSLLGPNGAGKTSTITVCEGFRRPTSGSVRVLGRDPVADAEELRPRVGVMLQEGGAWLGARTGEMLRYVASLHAHPLDVTALLDRLGLVDHVHTPWRRLSGGQKQRLGLAMAVAGRPELVFLDEPTAGLDPQARRATWDLVSDLRSAGVSVVLTTHHMDEAHALSDRIHIIDHGRLVASGTPEQLLAEAASRRLLVEVDGAVDFRPLLVAEPGLGTVEDLGAGRHRFDTIGTPDLLAVVAAWCAEHAVPVTAIRIERPTLEERFIDLTGRALR